MVYHVRMFFDAFVFILFLAVASSDKISVMSVPLMLACLAYLYVEARIITEEINEWGI